MAFLNDFVYYSSGTEVPEKYTWWAGLSLLGHILGNKVWVRHGDYFRFHPNLYIALVGTAGSGKNTGLSVSMEIMIEHFPRLLMSASIQSREDISFLMSQEDCRVDWVDKEGYLKEPGKLRSYRPFYIMNNELASFLSVDKVKMIEFLTEVFDGRRFSTGFKGDRKENPSQQQWFDNPHVSMIAGAVPTYFMGTLKVDLFERGLGRRLLIVSDTRTKIEPTPRKPVGADAAIQRSIEFLKKAQYCRGPVTLDDHATVWWEEWYRKNRNKPPEDTILAQFHETKHMMLLKIATLLAKAENLDTAFITSDHLEGGLALIENLEPGIVRLTSGIGRNELAGVGTEIMIAIEAAGGMIEQKRILAAFFRQTPGGMPKLNEVLIFLQKTDKLKAMAPAGNPDKAILFTPERYEKYMKEREAKPHGPAQP